MEKSFDFGALLKNNEKKHKSRPTQFVSVAGGVQKRLQSNIENRKSNRLTVFDSIRNLPRCESPAPISEAKLKMEHRRQQLEKWKTEKEQKKKEQAAQKKKPFITGVARNPMKFVPPPPLPKPSTSGRVTRSQTKTATQKPSPVKPTPKGRNTQSFAPINASFKPPEIKNLTKLPKLAPPTKPKNKKASMICFEPVIPNTTSANKQSKRLVLTRQTATETEPNSWAKPRNTRSRITKKPSPKKLTKKPLQSSSSGSDLEPAKTNKNKTTARKSFKEPNQVIPKLLVMGSTSEEKSSDDSSSDKSKSKSLRKTIYSLSNSESGSDKFSSDIEPSSMEEPTVISKERKSLPRTFSPRTLTGTSSSDRISSDVEFIEESSPVLKLKRKSLPLTPKNSIPKSESNSEEKLRSPRSQFELSLTPEQIATAKSSPCVTMSRGKDNARKEMKWKLDEGLLDDDVSDVDHVDQFRKQLSSEIKRMTELCDTWDKILEQTVLPEPVQEAVLSAVGQCRLLMSQKLQQFASLVERCARPEPGTALVTPADLHGFWDMVFMQVENVDLRFKKLEELRQRNWVEDKPVPMKAIVSKPVAKKAVKPVRASRIKEMIAAARKAKKEQQAEKTFEGGFFSVRSPVRSPAPAPAPTTPGTPACKPNLLKAVLSSEAKKASTSKNSTPFAMLRASIMAKNAEYEGVALLPQTPQMNPVNISATPGRSILKSTNIDTIKSGKKSIKIVLFHATDSDQSTDKHSDMNESALDELTSNNEEHCIETAQDKENSPVFRARTRSQIKNLLNASNVEDTGDEVKTPRRSSRKKKEESEDTKKRTPSRTSGRKKAKEDEKSSENVEESTSKKMTRKSALQDTEANILEETSPTPKRSSRRNKVTNIC